MFKFKACKHNTNVKLQLQQKKLVCIDASITFINTF